MIAAKRMIASGWGRSNTHVSRDTPPDTPARKGITRSEESSGTTSMTCEDEENGWSRAP
jgi:hypothetical protein